MSTSPVSQQSAAPEVLYSERQWVPWYWWLAAIGAAVLTAVQLQMNRDMWWFIVPFILFAVFALWGLWQLSATNVIVEKELDGTRWLRVGGAQLPNSVVARSLAVPESAKRNAMGRQLDPAAFVASKSWLKEMVMIVLDDPEDPTPYWLVSTKNPQALLEAFLPGTHH
ncbi:DUF3093 domain-containing protein [Staphylococcus chromogenes]|nr:DUF3093 domain-containing protein [Staphylococcus chromogenes]